MDCCYQVSSPQRRLSSLPDSEAVLLRNATPARKATLARRVLARRVLVRKAATPAKKVRVRREPARREPAKRVRAKRVAAIRVLAKKVLAKRVPARKVAAIRELARKAHVRRGARELIKKHRASGYSEPIRKAPSKKEARVRGALEATTRNPTSNLTQESQLHRQLCH